MAYKSRKSSSLQLILKLKHVNILFKFLWGLKVTTADDDGTKSLNSLQLISMKTTRDETQTPKLSDWWWKWLRNINFLITVRERAKIQQQTMSGRQQQRKGFKNILNSRPICLSTRLGCSVVRLPITLPDHHTLIPLQLTLSNYRSSRVVQELRVF